MATATVHIHISPAGAGTVDLYDNGSCMSMVNEDNCVVTVNWPNLTHWLVSHPASGYIASGMSVVSGGLQISYLAPDSYELSVQSAGTIQVTFTAIVPPTVTTQAVTAIGPTSATANGTITITGGANATIRGFGYGLTETDTWDVHEHGSFGVAAFSLSLTSLLGGTTYHVRAYATNSAGTGYGSYVSFTTVGPQVVITGAVGL